MISCVVTVGVRWRYHQNLHNCGPQHTDPQCYLTILVETAVNIEMHLRSLAVRMVAVTLKHLNFCDKQILQP